MRNYLGLISVAGTVLMATGITGCVDDAYDLDNINTDIEVKVNDLVVPIKLDAITLSNVFDLNDDSVIKEGADGSYAVVLDGDFTSDPIKISEVSINPGEILPINTTIVKYDGTGVDLPPVNIGETAVAYEITEESTPFSFTSSAIDKSIRSLDKIKGNWTITLTLDLSDMNGLFNSLEFRNLILALPAGFHTTSYPCTDGRVSVGNLTVSAANPTVVVLDIDEIDLTKFNSAQYTFTPATGDSDNGTIHFDGKLGIVSGFLVGKTNATVSSQPQQVILNIIPVLSKIEVTSVTGTIGFALDNFSVDDARLTDLPDFLSDDNTHIVLANPQLYFSLNNPVASDNLKAVTGLTLTSYKNGNKVNTCSLDAGEEVVLGTDKGNAGPYNFCLSPARPAEFYTGYAGAEFVRFTSLSRLLEGDGLPSVIAVDFENPRVAEGKVVDFAVNRTLDAVKGNYSFYSPLQFDAGSQVIYSERETGWNDETIEKINIRQLIVNATVTNNLPFDITLSGTPLDKEGNPCIDPSTKQPVRIDGFTVRAGAQNEPVELRTVGTVTGLDGIEYSARATVTTPGEALKSSMPIKLENIRVRVSGNYIDTL